MLCAAKQAAPNLTINSRSCICDFSVCLFIIPGSAATIAAHSEFNLLYFTNSIPYFFT